MPDQKILIMVGVLFLVLLISAVRMARLAPHYGRSSMRWFFISLFFTALPAFIVFWMDYRKSLSAHDALRRRKKYASPEEENPE